MTTQAVKRGPGRPRKTPLPPQTHIELLSLFARDMIQLWPPTVDRTTGARTDPGRVLKFEDHRCLCPVEWMDEVKQTQFYRSGQIGEPGSPNLRFRHEERLRTVVGSLTTSSAQPKPPAAGWDEMPDDQLIEMIYGGSVEVMYSMSWEGSHRKRPTILLALAERLPGAPAHSFDPLEQGVEDLDSELSIPESEDPF